MKGCGMAHEEARREVHRESCRVGSDRCVHVRIVARGRDAMFAKVQL